MNINQRKALREALIAQGFERVHYTHDAGDGVYDEVWSDLSDGCETGVKISWGART